MKTVIEGRRGCGFRKPGGLYLRTDGIGATCGKLPIIIEPCIECERRGIKCGLKFSRGFTWIEPYKLFDTGYCGELPCGVCPVGQNPAEKAGLIWIGERYYPTPESFLREANKMGVSRRITKIPRGFEVGKTWIFLAHQKCLWKNNGTTDYKAAIFQIVKPSRIEYVVKGDETEEELKKMEKRGITPVKVIREQMEMEV